MKSFFAMKQHEQYFSEILVDGNRNCWQFCPLRVSNINKQEEYFECAYVSIFQYVNFAFFYYGRVTVNQMKITIQKIW